LGPFGSNSSFSHTSLKGIEAFRTVKVPLGRGQPQGNSGGKIGQTISSN